MLFGVQLMLKANPSFARVSLDIENAFGKLQLKITSEKLWKDPGLQELWYYF